MIVKAGAARRAKPRHAAVTCAGRQTRDTADAGSAGSHAHGVWLGLGESAERRVRALYGRRCGGCATTEPGGSACAGSGLEVSRNEGVLALVAL